MSFTLAEAQEYYEDWKKAYKATASGKSYTISPGGGSSRSLTRQDADYCFNQMNKWKREIDVINSGGSGGIETVFGTSY